MTYRSRQPLPVVRGLFEAEDAAKVFLRPVRVCFQTDIAAPCLNEITMSAQLEIPSCMLRSRVCPTFVPGATP